MTEAVLVGERAATGWTSMKLRGGPEAAAQARAAIRKLMPSLNGAGGDVELLVSELVTNAYRHSGAGDQPIELHVSIEDGRVRAEVADGGAGFKAEPMPEEKRGVGGWGLYLVDSMADRWGVRAGPPSSVWFEIAL
jgi:anti-sigma regulatory factor (Ser/Thr protein kinase)